MSAVLQGHKGLWQSWRGNVHVRSDVEKEPFDAGLQRRFVRPGRVGAGDGAGLGGDAGSEGAGFGDVFEAQPFEPAAEGAEDGETVQQTCGEGVPGADSVGDVDGRGRDGDAEAVEGGESAA